MTTRSVHSTERAGGIELFATALLLLMLLAGLLR
jgi:hypothetical protein